MFLSFGCSVSDKPKELLSITLSSGSSFVLKTDASLQIEALAHYSDATTENVSDTLSWSSSDTSLATVTKGLVTTFTKEGVVTIHYETLGKFPSGEPIFSGDILCEIKNATLTSIAVTPDNATLYIDATLSFVATASYDINYTEILTKSCTWTSSNPNIASVVDKGVIKGISEGNASITATESISGKSDTVNVYVKKPSYKSLTISSTEYTYYNEILNAEQTVQLEAYGTNDINEVTDITDKVTWGSSDTDYVTIDSKGLATAVAVGDVNITATLYSATQEIKNIFTLKVFKDKYLELYKDSKRVPFPYRCFQDEPCMQEIFLGSDDIIETFEIKAVGADFAIGALSVTNFFDYPLVGVASFEGLSGTGTTLITQDSNLSFSLKYTGTLTSQELIFSFGIVDELNQIFPLSFVSSYTIKQ
jgi:uncharacterized protein YjdB